MTIKASIIDMRTEALAATELGTLISIVWEQVKDIVIEVFADAASIIYTIKAGDEIKTTENINEIIEALEYALS